MPFRPLPPLRPAGHSVYAVPLMSPRQPFLFAQLLEAANHLLDGLVAADFHPNHARLTLANRPTYRRTDYAGPTPESIMIAGGAMDARREKMRESAVSACRKSARDRCTC